MEPHLGQPRRARRVRRAALQPGRLGRRPARRTTTCSRACAGRSRRSTPARSTARRSLPGVGARAGDRDRDVERQAGRADPPALHVRPRRPQPRGAEGHDRGQGDVRRAASTTSPTSSASPSTGPTRRRTATAYFSSGLLPVRAPGLDRRLPTLGTGAVRVARLPERAGPPARRAGPNGLLLNWNNQSAPGFMHGDDDPYGSVHRVELFDQFPHAGDAGRRRERDEPRRHRGRRGRRCGRS